MAFIAALLPNQADREFLNSAIAPHHVLWAESWRELQRLVRRNPAGAVVMDLHAETRKDGALRVFRFTQRFPLTPVIAWGDADGRELFRLGKAGAADVVVSGHADNTTLVREIVEQALSRGLWPMLESRLRDGIDADALELIRYASEHIVDQIQVPELASAFEVSISTLERRCERWGMPTPGRLLLWLRVMHGLRWLLEPGRSVESVGHQLGYSSGAAFRRAIKATTGGSGGAFRDLRGFEHAINQFIAECRPRPVEVMA
jgi:AraC-like DNA-binding protein